MDRCSSAAGPAIQSIHRHLSPITAQLHLLSSIRPPPPGSGNCPESVLDALRSGETAAQKSSPTRVEQNLEAGDKVRTAHALHTYITHSTHKLKGVFLNDVSFMNSFIDKENMLCIHRFMQLATQELYIHIHTYIHTYIQYMHTNHISNGIYKNILLTHPISGIVDSVELVYHPCIPKYTYIRTYLRIYVHTYMHSYIHTYIHTVHT